MFFMKIVPTQNFAHVSGRVFIIGRIYDVTEASADEFVKAGIASYIEEKMVNTQVPTKVKPKVKTPKAE